MKITYFIGSTTGGGAEHVICDLATYMSEHGHQSEILTVTKTEHSYPVGKQVKYSTIDTRQRYLSAMFRLGIKMFKLFLHILRERADLYIVFLPETIKALMFFKRLIKAPVIVSERSEPNSYTEKVQNQMLSAFRKADGCVFQTENAMNFYRSRGSGQNHPIVIPNAIAGDLPEPFDGTRIKEIVAVGRFMEQKNFPLLIQAFAGVYRVFPEYRLVIYGEGRLKENYIRLCEKLNITDRVLFPGFVDDIPNKIRSASAFVLSSDFEGMPNALIEAMAVGLPCISTDCGGGGAAFLIQHEINGLLVPTRDVERLTEAICSIIADEELAERLGREASKIRATLSKEAVYSRWKEYLEEVVGSNA